MSETAGETRPPGDAGEEEAAPASGGPAVDVALAVAAAAMLCLAFHPFGVWPLAFLALLPWIILLDRAPPARAMGLSALVAAVFFFVDLHWLRLPNPLAWIAASIGLGGYVALFYAGTWYLLRRSRLPVVLVVPVLWVAAEFLRGTLFYTAFPWLFLGHAVVDAGPLPQIADLGGAPLVSFVVAAVNAGLAALWIDRARPLRAGAQLTCALLLLAGALGYGTWRRGTVADEVREGPRLLVVQPNVPITAHPRFAGAPGWRPDDHPGQRRSGYLLELTREALDGLDGEVDLVLWPESSVNGERVEVASEEAWDRLRETASGDPRLRGYLQTILGTIQPEGERHLAEAAARAGAPVAAGWQHLRYELDGEELEETQHNSVFLVEPDGRFVARYDKIRLVPVSEFVPFKGTFLYRWQKELAPPGFPDFTRGEEVRVLEANEVRFAPQICFEVSFPGLAVQSARQGAELITCHSNDGWFLDEAELALATDLARFRAIETRRAFVRVVNTGISCFVDPLGEVRAHEVDGDRRQVEGHLVGRAETTDLETVYASLPVDLFGWLMVALSAVLLAGGPRLLPREDAARE